MHPLEEILTALGLVPPRTALYQWLGATSGWVLVQLFDRMRWDADVDPVAWSPDSPDTCSRLALAHWRRAPEPFEALMAASCDGGSPKLIGRLFDFYQRFDVWKTCFVEALRGDAPVPAVCHVLEEGQKRWFSSDPETIENWIARGFISFNNNWKLFYGRGVRNSFEKCRFMYNLVFSHQTNKNDSTRWYFWKQCVAGGCDVRFFQWLARYNFLSLHKKDMYRIALCIGTKRSVLDFYRQEASEDLNFYDFRAWEHMLSGARSDEWYIDTLSHLLHYCQIPSASNRKILEWRTMLLNSNLQTWMFYVTNFLAGDPSSLFRPSAESDVPFVKLAASTKSTTFFQAMWNCNSAACIPFDTTEMFALCHSPLRIEVPKYLFSLTADAWPVFQRLARERAADEEMMGRVRLLTAKTPFQ